MSSNIRKVKTVVEFALRAIGLALLVGGLGLIFAFILYESLADLGKLLYENQQPTFSSSQSLWFWTFYPALGALFIKDEQAGVILKVAKGMIALGILAMVWAYFTDGHEALIHFSASMASILASAVMLHWISLWPAGKIAILAGSFVFIVFLLLPLIFIVALLNNEVSSDGIIRYHLLQRTWSGLIGVLLYLGLIVKGIIQPYWRKFRQRFPYIGLKMFTDKGRKSLTVPLSSPQLLGVVWGRKSLDLVLMRPGRYVHGTHGTHGIRKEYGSGPGACIPSFLRALMRTFSLGIGVRLAFDRGWRSTVGHSCRH